MTIPPEHLDAAILAADPRIARRRADTAAMEKPSAAWKEETRHLEDAARVRVRRIVAALNGIDVENNVAAWTDPPAILQRRFADRLKTALLNTRVAAALDAELGAEAAATLMGEIAVL